MLIFELTAGKKTLKEYDPGRLPPKANFGTGVGPGVTPQMTATPMPVAVKSATPAAPTGNRVNRADPANPNIAAQNPYVQGRAGQGAYPTRFAKYDPSTSATANLDQGMRAMTTPRAEPETPAPAQASSAYKQPTYNVPLAKVPATNTMMPTNMSTTGAPAAAAPAPAVDPSLADADKVKLTPNKAEKVDVGGSIVKAMRSYNANQAGLGWLNPDDDKNPYNLQTDKEGKITIKGQPYDANNPEHVKAYKDFLNASGQAPATANPPATTPVATPATARPGTPPATANPPATTPVATPATARPGTPPATANPPATTPVATPATTRPGTPPDAAVQELIKRGYSPQGAAAEIAKQSATTAPQTPEQIRIAKQKAAAGAAQKSMTPKPTVPTKKTVPNFGTNVGPVAAKQITATPTVKTPTPAPVTAESLTWSRNFDPGQALYNKMKLQK
jgi:hypothetical protein